MATKERFKKARSAFEELKKQPSIGDQLTETSNLDDAYYFLKNYFDRYLTTLALQNREHTLYLEQDLRDILKRSELKGDVSEYQFVKTRVDSALSLIERLLKESE